MNEKVEEIKKSVLQNASEKNKARLLANQLTVSQFILDAMENSKEKSEIRKSLNSSIEYCRRLEQKEECND